MFLTCYVCLQFVDEMAVAELLEMVTPPDYSLSMSLSVSLTHTLYIYIYI